MKLLLFLTASLLLISSLLLQSNSFSKAEISNNVLLSIVEEESALIAITYGEEKTFEVTNNTDKTIEIERVELLDEYEEEFMNIEDVDSSIFPGEMKEFALTGNSKDLTGKVIRIITRWEGGNAEIQSTLPEFPEVKEPVSDITEELATPKPEEDVVDPEVIGDIVTELTDERIIPESEEPITPEPTDEQ
ncbi:hypothetical protein MHH81_03675 [Psychrobacillus sp. FSL H8-0484]|uniref:hypothetical protein n=1 Tax=Psychrobacillus sp. FSL H8-0484 TaxID=2921390 RepID=UPI0030F6A71D